MAEPSFAAGNGARTRHKFERAAPLLVSAIVTAACWVWSSPSLDDPDSALFVAGVERFSLAESRPHPPGYPIYILFGKLVALFGLGPREALQAVSCLSAGISAGLLPRFFKVLGFGVAGAWAAALAVLATPLFGLTSCKILTDTAGFAILLPLAISWLSGPQRTGLGYGAGLALGLGVRPHGILYLLPGLWLRPRALRLYGFFGMLLLLILGMVWIEGGENFRRAMTAQATMRFKTPGVSLFSPGTGLGGALERAMRFQMVFFRDMFGVSGMWLKILVFLLMSAGTLRLWKTPLSSGVEDAYPKRDAIRWLLGGAAFYMIFLFLFLPAHPRYLVPLIPIAIAALTFGRAWIALVLALLMLPISASRIARLHGELAPLELALDWIDQEDPDHEVPLLFGHMVPHARILVPELEIISSERIARTSEQTPRFFALWAEAQALVEAADSPFVVTQRRVFQRPVELHDKLATVEVVLIERR